MTLLDLVQASAAGKLFYVVDVPSAGDRVIAPHLFTTKDGGIAFVDGNWTDPEAAGHVAHVFKVEFVRGDAMGVVLRKAGRDGKLATVLPAFPSDPAWDIYREHLTRTKHSQAQDRAAAKAALERVFQGLELEDDAP